MKYLTRGERYFFFVVSFLLGILLASFLYENDYVKVFVVLFVVMFWGRRFYREWLLFFSALLIGGIRFFYSFDLLPSHISNFLGDVEFNGCIVREVDVRVDKVKYVFDSEEYDGNVLVVANKYPLYSYGECFYVSGYQIKPGKLDDFAYDKYLARYGIYSVLYDPVFEPLDVHEAITVYDGNFIYDKLYILKMLFEVRLGQLFAEPEASFMAGLIVGSRKGIPDDLMADFNTTGLTHIIAISGYNITLVIVIVSSFLGFLSRRQRIFWSILFIFLFVVFVGASAAVVRAGIMGIISLLALWDGRQSFVLRTLFFSAFFMNLWNPKILPYDVGFQLSFLATLGLIVVSPLIEKYFKWLPELVGVRESVLMTMSAQISALPIIVYNFGRLSVISPIANLFVLPFLPLAMAFGFFAVVSSGFSFGFGMVFAFFGFLILRLIVFFVAFFASVSFASVDVDWFPWWFLLLYYFVLVRWVFRFVSPLDNSL